jgi:hypothetical protein
VWLALMLPHVPLANLSQVQTWCVSMPWHCALWKALTLTVL